MLEVLTTPRGPNPFESFKAVHGPTIAKWVVHRSRRKREKEIYQDWKRHPWKGERQAQTDAPRTAKLAATLDRELAKVPAVVMRNLPRSGNYPTVVGFDDGPGPNPWFGSPPSDEQRAAIRAEMAGPPPDYDFRVRPLEVNGGNYEDGPHSTPSIWTAPIPAPNPILDPNPPNEPIVVVDGAPPIPIVENNPVEAIAADVNNNVGRAPGLGTGPATNAHPGGGAGAGSTLITSAALEPMEEDWIPLDSVSGKTKKGKGKARFDAVNPEKSVKKLKKGWSSVNLSFSNVQHARNAEEARARAARANYNNPNKRKREDLVAAAAEPGERQRPKKIGRLWNHGGG